MPIRPFRLRVTDPGNSPPWLRDGTGERYLYTCGLMVDARMSRLIQGMMARMPRSSLASYQAPTDALNITGGDRQIPRGPLETDAAYAVRVQRAPSMWQIWGNSRALLTQLNAFFTPQIPTIYIVTNAGQWSWMTPDGAFHVLAPSARPPAIASNWVWDSSATAPASISVTGAAAAGGAGSAVKLTVTSTAALTNGQSVDVSGVVGSGGLTAAANGSFAITVNDSTHITLLRSVFAGSYAFGGTVQPPPAWWRFWVIVDCSGGFPFASPHVWGEAGLLWGASGLLWGVGGTGAAGTITGMRRVIQQWMPEHSICTNIILDFQGHFQPTGSGAGYPGGNWDVWANRWQPAAYLDGVSP